MKRLHNILDMVSAYDPNADLDLIRKAYVFSARAHQGQTRRSGEPYLTHPVGVAAILADMKLDVPSIAAGILHDTVEDTLTSLEEIEKFRAFPRIPWLKTTRSITVAAVVILPSSVFVPVGFGTG